MIYNLSGEVPHFSEEAVDALATDFSISNSQKQNLKFMLEQGAGMYYSAKSAGEADITPADTRATLNKLMRRAAALQETLEELPDNVVRRLNKITSSDSISILENGGRGFHDQSTLTFEPVGTIPGASISRIEVHGMIHFLEAVARLSAETKEQIPNAKFGRPSDQALDIWIANLALFWIKHLGRKFTRDDMGGGIPLSLAAEFCSQASGYLDEEIPGTLIMKSMKKYIKNNK